MREIENLGLPHYEHFPRLENTPKEDFPKWVFITPDGNRRWAKKHGMDEIEGHIAGMNRSLELLRQFRELPIEGVILWGFSTDNWRRNSEKVSNLMRMFDVGIKENINELDSYNSRFIHLGDKETLPDYLSQTLTDAEERTSGNTGQKVAVAINFNGTNQEIRVMKKVAESVHSMLSINPGTSLETVNQALGLDEKFLTSLRDGGGLVPPSDLLIRTGQPRTSDVGWLNGKSTIIVFHEDTLYPDLQTHQVEDAILKYAAAQHNHGA